ncbi:MAG: hypothetical protein WCI18_05055 [Pseudomonadota bacterium]
MSFTKTTLASILLSTFISSSSFAFPIFLKQFGEHYDANGIDTSKLVDNQSCALCHNSAGGGGPRNPYGESFKAGVLGEGKGFDAIEFIDSDGDNFINLEEIYLNTAPGDSNDAPSSRIAISVTSGKVSVSLPATCTSFELISFGVKIEGSNKLVKTNISGTQTLALDGSKGAILAKCVVENAVGSLLLK